MLKPYTLVYRLSEPLNHTHDTGHSHDDDVASDTADRTRVATTGPSSIASSWRMASSRKLSASDEIRWALSPRFEDEQEVFDTHLAIPIDVGTTSKSLARPAPLG